LEEIAAALRKGGDQRAGRSERNHRERGANGHEHRPKHR
jgi:hypothetical protein